MWNRFELRTYRRGMISSREQHILRYGSGEIPNQMLTWFVINCEKHGAGRISLVRFLRQIQG